MKEKPTFLRGDSKSWIDVTYSTQGIAKQIANPTILDEEPLSDHYEIKSESQKKRDRKIITTDWATFGEVLDWRIEQTEEDNIPESYSGKPYCWNRKIATNCTLMRRRVSRLLRRMDVTEEKKTQLKDEYPTEKRALQKQIPSSKQEHWNDLNDDIWGDGYKIAAGCLASLSPVDLTEEIVRNIVTTLFPHRYDEKPNISKSTEIEMSLFTKDELRASAERLNAGKAPGLDGIPAEAIKITAKTHSGWLLSMLNQQLTTRVFPKQWRLPDCAQWSKKEEGLITCESFPFTIILSYNLK
ncbi:hypothetical protein JTB14_026753 [Gonioctena quinquepunctata]|nr:hypothetical protein JTB14_026753 [Gonioctena quinquepunctata]